MLGTSASGQGSTGGRGDGGSGEEIEKPGGETRESDEACGPDAEAKKWRIEYRGWKNFLKTERYTKNVRFRRKIGKIQNA